MVTDSSLWKGCVQVLIPARGRKDEFVIRECLNIGTREFIMKGDPVHLASPTRRFPRLKLVSQKSGACGYQEFKRCRDWNEERKARARCTDCGRLLA